MSNFKNKTEEILENGKKERGEYVPSGAPLRMYNYWLDEIPSYKRHDMMGRKENFCHFWRVVAIWAPLRWVGNKIVDVIEHPVTWIVLGLTVLAIVIFGSISSIEFLKTVLFILGTMVVVVAGIAIGIYAEEHWPESWVPATKKTALGFVGLLIASLLALIASTAPFVFIPLYAFVATGAVVIWKWGPDIMDALEARSDAKKAKRKAELEAWIAENGEPTHVAKEPGIVSRFFSGVWDFLVLGAQVIRVNKWKICPYVDTNSNKDEEYV